MARVRDESKKQKILGVARRLFAVKGFGETSIADLVRETGLPVGTLYTYFPNKEEILRTIIEEGWSDLEERLTRAVASLSGPEERIQVIVEQFLPELLDQGELVEIVLSEPEELTGLGQKLEKLTTFLTPLISDYIPLPGESTVDRRRLKTALAVYFLGIVHAARLSQRINPGFGQEDILALVRDTINSAILRD